MSTGGPTSKDDPEETAGEYVLGTLSPAERTAFEEALIHDPALRAAVQAWEVRLAPLANDARLVAPDPSTWTAISARLAPQRSAALPDGVTDAPVVALRRALRRWRFAAIGSGALAAGLALFLAVGGIPRPAGPQYVAVVNRGGELPALVVRVDTGAGTIQVRSLAAETPADRSLELWFVGAGAAPRSLGVLADPAARFSVPAALRAGAEDGSLAVSVEPKGGSPTGAPTGPVVYSGRLVRD